MAILRFIKRSVDFCLTLLLWAYFTFGYLFILLLFFVPSSIHLKTAPPFFKNEPYSFEMFFAWLRFLAPRTTFKIDQAVSSLRSSIIVCNHISYLDPILLVSLFPRQTTIVKNTFFSVPIFGWF